MIGFAGNMELCKCDPAYVVVVMVSLRHESWSEDWERLYMARSDSIISDIWSTDQPMNNC